MLRESKLNFDLGFFPQITQRDADEHRMAHQKGRGDRGNVVAGATAATTACGRSGVIVRRFPFTPTRIQSATHRKGGEGWVPEAIEFSVSAVPQRRRTAALH